MADINKNINITGNSNSAQDAVDALGQKFDNASNKGTEFTQVLEREVDTQVKLKNALNESSNAHNLNTDAVVKNGGAISILDSLTGGMASQFKNAYEASGLFNASLGKMKTALIATGIGALVVALGLIVAYWDDIVDFVTQASNAQENYIRNLELTKGALISNLSLIDKEIILAEENGENTDELRRQKIKIIEAQREINNNLIRQLELELEIEKSGENQEGLWNTIVFHAKGLISTQLQAQHIAQNVLDSTEAQNELQDRINKLKGENLDFDIASLKMDKDRNKEGREALKIQEDIAKAKKLDEAEERRRELEEHQKMLEEIERLENEYLTNQLDKQTQELNQVQDKYFKLIEYARENGEDITLLEEARLSEIEEINEKYVELERDKQEKIDNILQEYDDARREREILKEEDERLKVEKQLELDLERLDREEQERILELERLGAHKDEIKALEDFYADERVRKEQETSDAIIEIKKREVDAQKVSFNQIAQLAQTGIAIAQSVAGESKALAIASTVIDTISSSVQVFKGFTKDTGPVGYALGIAAMAASLASGYAQVKKIQSTKIPGGKGGGSAGGGVGAPPAIPEANFNIIGQDSNSQLAQTINSQNNEPVKAYVVSTEVSSQQELDRNRNSTATFL